MPESVEEREQEFEAHLWDHAADPFQAAFDLREDLTQAELNAIGSGIDVLARDGTDEDLTDALYQSLRADPEFGPTLLQLVGLTANKIKSDLDAAAESRKLGTRFPSDPTKLARR